MFNDTEHSLDNIAVVCNEGSVKPCSKRRIEPCVEPCIEPHIKWAHEHGPTLICHDGTTHILSMLERLTFSIGVLTIDQLDKKYSRDPQKG